MQISISMKGRLRDERQPMSGFNNDGILDSWLQLPSTSKTAGDKGATNIQVSGDGTNFVAVSVRNDASGRSATVREFESTEIEVRTSAGRQTFEIKIPEEGLKQAMEQVAKR